MRKSLRRTLGLAVCVVLVMGLFTACGKKEKSGLAGNFDDLKDVQAKMSGESADEEAVSSAVDTKLSLSEDSGVPKDAIAKIYPAREKDSYFQRFVKEAPEEVFVVYDENDTEKMEALYGMPYYIEGTVRKVYDDITKMKFGENVDITALEESTAYVIDVDGINVMVYDLLPDLIRARKEAIGNDMASMAAYKALYDKLKPYEDHPQEGEYVRIYGFYAGFDQVNEMPGFYYGFSKMVYNTIFGAVYPRLVTDEMVQDKYLNYVDFEKPVYWSAMRESSTEHWYYFDNGSILWDNYENDENEQLSWFVDMFFEGWDPEEDSHLNLLEMGYTTVGNGIEAYRARYTYTVEETQTYMYSEAIIFEHKHRFIVLRYYDYLSGEAADFDDACFGRLVDSIKLRAN